MEFNLENPFTNFQDFSDDDTEIMESLFLIESDHMPAEKYIKNLKARGLDEPLRLQAISSILQFSYKFDPFLSYLAINYMDRFLSSQEMPQPKPWILRLLAVSCLSLAAKMRQIEFSFTDFQGDGGLVFDTPTIQRTEYIILGALKWRMRSVTPFSFLSFFISMFMLRDPPSKEALKARANEIIFRTQDDINLLEFKPSIIAASVLLSACRELFPLQFCCFIKTISQCSFVSKEKMLQCYSAIEEGISRDEYESGFDMVSSSDTLTPVNVLDRGFLSSSESDKTNVVMTASNCANGSATVSPDTETTETKRSKLSGYCNNHSIQLSQIQHC